MRPDVEEPENRVLLMISLMILLAGSFALRYVGHTYFADEFFDFYSPGLWLLLGNVFLAWEFCSLIKKRLDGPGVNSGSRDQTTGGSHLWLP